MLDIDLKDRRAQEQILVFALMLTSLLLIFFGLFLLLVLEVGRAFLNYQLLFIFSCIIFFIQYFFLKSLISSYREREKRLDSILKETLHELKVPISTIFANSEMLISNTTDKRSLNRIKRVELAAKKLQNDYELLELAIRDNLLVDEKEEFNIKPLIYEVSELFRERALSLDIEIAFELENYTIRSSKAGFSKLISNMIDNAIKYNKRGGFVKIELKGGILRFEDSGIGMSESEILRIFDRYYQGEYAKDGYGIGLGYVKEFCDKQKIDIKIKSQKDRGSEFIFILKS